MNGVMPSVSAGSSQRGASVTWAAQDISLGRGGGRPGLRGPDQAERQDPDERLAHG